MPYINYRKDIVITNVGGNLQQDVTEPIDTYYVSGSAIMLGNLQITPLGTPAVGLTFFFVWKANLDIVTNSTTVTVFGKVLTAVQVTKLNYITASYNGSSWDVDIQTSDGSTAFIENFQLGANIVQSSNIANGAIGTTQIANASVTLAKLAANSVDSSKIVDGSIVTIDLADDSVTTPKIVDLNVTTGKINDLAVTTGKINTDAVTTAKILDYNVTANKIGSNAVTTVKILDANVTTAKVADDAITNGKLATMTPSSIKTGDSSGNPTDLFIGLDEIPIGNGTSVTTINKSTLVQNKQIISIPLLISFESGEQTTTKTVWYLQNIPGYYLSSVYISVISDIAATDNAIITVNIDTKSDILFNSPTFGSNIIIPASTVKGTGILFSSADPAYRTNDNPYAYAVNLTASKVTPGGKVIATVTLHEL